ncbi:MAG: hypothetical protein GX963_05040 [Bacteroidales bacterium]|nr:hypothetical protein [Bacteroidales bacterium]
MMVWDRVKLAVEQMYKIYEEAGSPYGDESDDMYRWFIDLKDQEELKQKHAQQIIELRCKQLVREGFREKERTI